MLGRTGGAAPFERGQFERGPFERAWPAGAGPMGDSGEELVMDDRFVDARELGAVGAPGGAGGAGALAGAWAGAGGPRVSVRTLFLSDVHLGSPASRASRVADLLQRVECDELILAGDIIDGWQIRRRRAVWTADHTRVIAAVLHKLQRQRTRVVYVRGNHDDFLASILPLALSNLAIVESHVHLTDEGPLLVAHGDAFDAVVPHSPLKALGAAGYGWLLRANRVYNRYRRLRGKGEFSLAKAIKGRLASAHRFVAGFEQYMVELARQRGCVGVVCGHVHCAADKRIDGVRYLNCGDWVESATAVVERHDGTLALWDLDAQATPDAEAGAAAGAAAGATIRVTPAARVGVRRGDRQPAPELEPALA